MVDGAQRMSDVLSDNCARGETSEPAHCRGATSNSGFPTFQASSCAQHPPNALKRPGTTVCLPSLITVKQDATYSVYYTSVGSSTCFMY